MTDNERTDAKSEYCLSLLASSSRAATPPGQQHADRCVIRPPALGRIKQYFITHT